MKRILVFIMTVAIGMGALVGEAEARETPELRGAEAQTAGNRRYRPRHRRHRRDRRHRRHGHSDGCVHVDTPYGVFRYCW